MRATGTLRVCIGRAIGVAIEAFRVAIGVDMFEIFRALGSAETKVVAQ